MALSEEDKKRIEEEEAYRAEVREGKKKKKGSGCLGVFVVIVILALAAAIPSWIGQSKTNSQPRRDNFKAEVNFTGSQFEIKNNDDLDCENAKMQVNGINGYSLNGYKLEAGQSYTVGAMQFTKDDGTRLNPFLVKPKSFNIYCSSIGATNALSGSSWYGEFK